MTGDPQVDAVLETFAGLSKKNTVEAVAIAVTALCEIIVLRTVRSMEKEGLLKRVTEGLPTADGAGGTAP